MSLFKRRSVAFIDFFLWLIFTFYVVGGFNLRGHMVFAYPKDLFHVAIILLLLAMAVGVNLADLSLVKSFGQLNDFLLNRKTKPQSVGGWVVLVSSGYLIVLFIFTPLLRHWSYGTWRWDLGAIQQVIWRGAYGYGFTSTIILNGATPPLDFLRQQHLELWLVPLSWLYRCFPHTETLIIVQSLALMGCLVALWKIARRLLPPTVPPLLVPVLFWFNENIHRVNIWDVHENAFIPFFCLWAFHFFLTRRWALVAVFTLLVASFKEDAWVIAGAMGCYFLCARRKYFLGAVAALFGFGFFVGYGALVTVQTMALSARYGYLGQNLHEAVAIVKRRPWVFLQQLFAPANLKFFKDLFMMGGGSWLAAGGALITLAPVFFEIALSTYEPARNLNDHYVTPLIGSLFYCTCLGIKKISENEKWRPHLPSIVALMVLISLWPLEYSEPANVQYMLSTQGFKMRRCYDDLLAHLPPQAPVYANDPFSTRVANRPIVLKYAKDAAIDLPGAYVIFDEADPAPQNTELIAQACGYKVARNTAP